MWIFAGGMFRSGSTLQFQLISTLIERSSLGRRLEWRTPEDFAGLAEQLGDPSEMLVFKTHVCKHPMRIRLLDGRARAVAVHRDLRDVIVSGAHKDGISPTPDYCSEMTKGCLACYNGWPVCEAVRWWAYDRFVDETADCIMEMAEHIRVPCDLQTARQLAEEFSPERQRKRIDSAIREGRMRPAIPGDKRLHAEGDLLHPNHVRDGRTGQWITDLSPDAVRAIETIAGAWLTSHGYRLSLEPAEKGTA